jgi:hypothetical protein
MSRRVQVIGVALTSAEKGEQVQVLVGNPDDFLLMADIIGMREAILELGGEEGCWCSTSDVRPHTGNCTAIRNMIAKTRYVERYMHP